ncbi:MAG: Maf family protein [Clostridia bacterium]
MKKFILASASPRRREILEDIGLKVTVVPSVCDESEVKITTPEKYVMELALLKGADVARCADKNDIVISADTVVVKDGKIMGKPKDTEDALKMLLSLSDSWHSVLTGYCVINGENGEASVRYETTRVKFRPIDEKEARCYIKTKEPMDKAGSYGIQGKGRLFVERIEGDYFNVVGLPVCALAKMLHDDFGIDLI